MNESVVIGKEVDAKKGFSSARRNDKSINHTRNEPDRQLDSLGGVIGNIKSNGGTPSVESIATQLSGVHTAQRAPVLLALQQTHGNRYVQRVVAVIQAKLAVGQPGDKYEQEADRVAEQVMRMPEPQVRRQVEPEEEEEELLQAKSMGDVTPEGTHDLESQITMIRGGGKSLSESERAFFEPRFGADFGQVRVHTGTQAAESAQALNARAYTMGHDVVFGAGQYVPGTGVGRRLMAHELTHVVQQGATRQLSLYQMPLAQYQFTAADAIIQLNNLPPECEDLLVQILARIAELARRAAELVANQHSLPLRGPMSIEGHQQQFRNKQVNLRRLLNDWDTFGCGPPPRNAWRWATRSVPSPAPRPSRPPARREITTEPNEPLVTPEEVATVAGVAVAGYIAYRVIRMIPSLLPPLWWTIPANVAVP